MPPVDIQSNSPNLQSAHSFRSRHGIKDSDILIVTVSRLVDWMKAESLRRTIEAVRTLERDRRIRFAIVGDGSSRGDLERFAAQVNSEVGREAVILTGAMLDPRPAYAGADIVVGMGGSALRGMAFSKPVIIVGEQGFSRLFNSNTEKFFYHNGMFGEGDGTSSNDQLVDQIRHLLRSKEERISIGKFARRFVERHYSLEVIGPELDDILVSAAGSLPRFSHRIGDVFRTASLVATNKLLSMNVRHTLKSR